MSLVIKNLHANVQGTEILKGINLEIPKGEVHAIMGPNGSGKSTLSKVLCGHPDYEVTEGEAWLDGQNLLDMSIDERSRAGLFLAFQYPMEVPGVSNANFLRAAMQARMPHGEELDAVTFYKTLYAKMDQLGMARKFTSRAVNEGFSGGEKKRNEVLQMLLLDPLYAILDETDSGLDIDASALSRKESTPCVPLSGASWSSPTTNACWTTSGRMWSTCWLTGGLSGPEAENWWTNWKAGDTSS